MIVFFNQICLDLNIKMLSLNTAILHAMHAKNVGTSLRGRHQKDLDI